MIAPGMFQQMQAQCDVCGGKGKIVKSKCPHCQGKKVKRGNTQTTVTIERGMFHGQEIRIEGGGDESPDHSPGDLIYTLDLAPHPVFERKGDHLYVSETISLKEALLGFSHTIKHLDGSELKIRRTSITQPGNLF